MKIEINGKEVQDPYIEDLVFDCLYKILDVAMGNYDMNSAKLEFLRYALEVLDIENMNNREKKGILLNTRNVIRNLDKMNGNELAEEAKKLEIIVSR